MHISTEELYDELMTEEPSLKDVILVREFLRASRVTFSPETLAAFNPKAYDREAQEISAIHLEVCR